MGCLILVLVVGGLVTLPSIWGPLIFWSLAGVLFYQKAGNRNQARQLEEQKRLLEEQRKQNRELIKAVNPQAYQELVAKEAKEEEEVRREGNKRTVYKVLAVGVSLVVIVIAVSTNNRSDTSHSWGPGPASESHGSEAGKSSQTATGTTEEPDSPQELRKFLSAFLVVLQHEDKGECVKYLAPILENYFENKNVSREVAVDLEVPHCRVDENEMTVKCLRAGEYVVEGPSAGKTLSAGIRVAADKSLEIERISLGPISEVASSPVKPIGQSPTAISGLAHVQSPVPSVSAVKVSSLPVPLKNYPGDKPRKDGIGVATEVLLGQTPVAWNLNDLKSALQAIARKDKKALSAFIEQGKVAIWPEHTYCFDAWIDLSDQLKLFRPVYAEDPSQVVWIPASVVEGPAIVSDANIPKSERVDGGAGEESKENQKVKNRNGPLTGFNPFGRNLLDARCASALVDCEGQGLAYYSRVENVVSEDDPAEQAHSYLNAEEASLIKRYGAKGCDIYEDGFYRTVNDIFETDLGPEPRADWFDGGIKEIGDPVIRSMNDPNSYKFDRFTTETTQYDKTWCWKVDYYFRGKNTFGAVVLNHVFAYFRKGQLIAIKEVTD